MMKEQGAGRACKDDWAQIVGNNLLPETESHPEGLSWGAKCLRMACLWLMGRAMVKIAPFLPKRSKQKRPKCQGEICSHLDGESSACGSDMAQGSKCKRISVYVV